MPSRKDLSAVLVYPNTPEVAFASLGFLKVFEMLKDRVALADVCYLPGRSGRRPGPEAGLAGELGWQATAGGRPRGRAPGAREAAAFSGGRVLSRRQGMLLGHFSGREVRTFDVVAFSVSYENDLVHVPGLLLAAGIQPLAESRAAAPGGGPFPLVLFGGFVMSMNPLPIADFADAIAVGEAEALIDAVLSAAAQVREQSAGELRGGAPGAGARAGLLARLAAVPGVYVPSLDGAAGRAPRVRRVWTAADGIAPEPAPGAPSHFGDMLLVEVGRGCGRGCLFCAAGQLYRPVRMRSEADIVDAARRSKRVGLVGTAVGDHPSLERILGRLVQAGCEVGISSFRADEMTPEIAALLVAGGVRTLAIAPEAGSESLRRRVGKTISDRQLTEAVGLLADAGMATIKLYYMIGLPGETDADAEAIVDLTERLSLARGRARLSVAVGPFVPKPHTAFQWSPFADRATLKRRVGIIRRVGRIRGCSLRVGSLEEAWLEAVLARGGRSLGGLLLEAALRGVSFRALAKRLLRTRPELDPTRALDVKKPLPWDFITAGVSGKRLEADFLRAQRRSAGRG